MRYPLARWSPSPNHSSRSGVVVDHIVIHHTDGQPRLARAVEHLSNLTPSSGKRVSAHFVIGRLGEVVQLVDLDRAAWHCSGCNARSVGIEHVARTPGEFGSSDAGLPLTEAQLVASAALVAWLCKQLSLPVDGEHILPHCASPTTTHKDCGRDVSKGGIWPWDRYLEMVRQAAIRQPI